MATVSSTEQRDLRERRQDESGKVAAIWVLYLVALFTGLTLLIGVVLAYLFRGDAPEWLRTHYDKQIATFWWGVVWALIGGVLVAVGGPLSFVLIGIPFLLLGLFILGVSWLYVLVRSVQGLKRLKNDQPI